MDRMLRGLVHLTPEFWDLVQVDIDGAALQAIAFRDYGELLDPALIGPTPIETGAPALRSADLALARQHRGDQLIDDLTDRRDRTTAGRSKAEVDFNAEDQVVRGRVDVWDNTTKTGPGWHGSTAVSLSIVSTAWSGTLDQARRATSRRPAAASEREDHPTPSDDLYLYETVATWGAGASPLARESGSSSQGRASGRPPIMTWSSRGAVAPDRSQVAVKPEVSLLRLGHTV